MPVQEPEGVDPRNLPQTTIRKMVKQCLENGVFDTTPFIDQRPMIEYVPEEVIAMHKPQVNKGMKTVRYSPSQKSNETPELLQLAGELHNHKILEELRNFFRANNLKAFYATAEKVLRVECGNPVVRSVIVEDQLISDRDQVDKAIAEYFQGVYGREDLEAETDGDLLMWERFQEAAGAMQGMFTMRDVEEAMKASNFNKGLGPDGFDGTILRPGDMSHRLTQEISAKILRLLNNPMSIP